MKTEFKLEPSAGQSQWAKLKIIGSAPDDKPYVMLEVVNSVSNKTQYLGWIPDRSLKLFAMNILASLGATKLTIRYDKPKTKKKKL